jgi:ubiquitin-activating enzyme E1
VTELLPSLGPVEVLNEKLRAAGVGFILSETLGAAGYTFLDFGDKHQVFDQDGEPTKEFIVSRISKDNEAVVTVHEDKRHSF